MSALYILGPDPRVPPASLAAAQEAQGDLLEAACAAAIVSGFTSSALGAAHTYPSGLTDQANLTASVLASLLPSNSAGWTTAFLCADASGAWAFRDHTAAQIQGVGQDGKDVILAARVRLAGLNDKVAAAQTISDVQAITW